MTDQPAAPRSFATNAANVARNTQTLHLQLSAMADQKASILMAASFVIFTITINQAKGSTPPLPLLVLGAFAFASAVLTVLAIVPKTYVPPSAPLDLMFFGSFARISQAEYVDRFTDAMADEETMIRTVAADIYTNGVILRRKKYRFLEYAYRTFLTGLVVTAIVFVAERF